MLVLDNPTGSRLMTQLLEEQADPQCRPAVCVCVCVWQKIAHNEVI